MNTIQELIKNDPIIYRNINRYREEFKYSNLTKKQKDANIQDIRRTPKTSRNAPCKCGSGIKYKKCCINKN